MSASKKSSFSPFFWLVLLLFAAVLHNTYIHWTSPAYRFYKEQFENLKKQNEDYKASVETEFIPAVSQIASNMVVLAKSDFSGGASIISSSSSSLPVMQVETYSNVRVKAGGHCERGGYIDGNFYRLGDTYLGSPIRDFSPECAITRDFIIIPSSKFKLYQDSFKGGLNNAD